MNFNFLPFIKDMADVLRLRYQPIDHYRYGLPIFVMVMLTVGVANALILQPIFGGGQSILAFAIVFALLKWLLLTRATTAVLHYFGSPRIPFLGYTLLTEALTIPMIFLPILPEMAIVFQIWNMWIFWVQLLGFAQISEQSMAKVLVAYVVYIILVFIFTIIMLQLFHLGGWLDLAVLQNNMREFLANQPR